MTDPLTVGLKCRATSVSKKHLVDFRVWIGFELFSVSSMLIENPVRPMSNRKKHGYGEIMMR